MKERKPWIYIKLGRLVIDIGPGEWKAAIGYEGSRKWVDRYLYLTIGILYIRLWLTGEPR
jgi:hypothetical protein